MKRLFGLIFTLALCSMTPCSTASAAAVERPLAARTEVSAGASWPLIPRPEVVRGFEPPPEPWLPGHRGIDLLGHVGQQVRSPLAGTILYAGPLAGRGVVVVSHGKTRTTYEPVLASVHIGERVPVGASLGTLSAVPSHCAPRVCLHWGLVRGSTYLDPLTLITSIPVRLLPLSNSPASIRRPAPHAESTPTDVRTPKPSADSAPVDDSGTDDGTSVAGGAAVAVAGLLTIGGALLIGRH